MPFLIADQAVSWGRNTNSASRSIKLRINHGQATRSTLIFSRVIHFIIYIFYLMASWFWYAVVAAVLYGAHQIFTRMAADHIGEGLGGFVVEATAAFSILLYLAFLWLISRWDQKSTGEGIFYSVLTGVCVGAGTIAFFLLFQKGGPLSSVPAILAGGAAIMAIAGILFFHEAPSWQRLAGVAFAITGLFLLRR